jgi:DNA-binding protein HU-beta
MEKCDFLFLRKIRTDSSFLTNVRGDTIFRAQAVTAKSNPFTIQEMPMTKAEIIEQMAQDVGITKTAAAAALQSLIDSIGSALKKKDGKVTLTGFGTFAKTRRKARNGRNPQTGETIKIKAHNVVTFKAGKKLKATI